MRAGRALSARLLLTGAVVVATTVGCANGVHTSTSANVGLVHVHISQYRGDTVTPARSKPHIVLTDTSGHRYDFLTKTAARVTLLFFGYTHCPDECPLT